MIFLKFVLSSLTYIFCSNSKNQLKYAYKLQKVPLHLQSLKEAIKTDVYNAELHIHVRHSKQMKLNLLITLYNYASSSDPYSRLIIFEIVGR